MEIFVLIRIPSLEKTNTQSQNFLETALSVFLISPHTSSFMPQGLRYVLFLIYIVGKLWMSNLRPVSSSLLLDNAHILPI